MSLIARKCLLKIRKKLIFLAILNWLDHVMTSVWLTVICVSNLVLRTYFANISVKLILLTVLSRVLVKPVVLRVVKIVSRRTVNAETRSQVQNTLNARNGSQSLIFINLRFF